jgi:hypothetical protein
MEKGGGCWARPVNGREGRTKTRRREDAKGGEEGEVREGIADDWFTFDGSRWRVVSEYVGVYWVHVRVQGWRHPIRMGLEELMARVLHG